MPTVFEEIRGKLIVSSQAAPGDPLEHTESICRMAMAAIHGGAAGLRLNSSEHIAAVRKQTALPIIGIHKAYGPAGLRITPDFRSAAELAAAGASIIALDCTGRVWPDGEPWQEVIARVHKELGLPVMADIATFDEALAAQMAGADCVGTTLHGYTAETSVSRGFNWRLLEQLAQQLSIPVMAEGHISTPDEARRAIAAGAWCAIVGSAITRPGTITARFVKALERPGSSVSAIGVDIGGTAIKAGLVTSAGEVHFPTFVPTAASKGRDAIAEGVIRAIDQVRATVDSQRPGTELAGIGIATAGAVDQSDGSIFAATENLPGWAGFALRAFVEERFRLATFVVNDAQAAALSELHFGRARGLSSFAMLTLGTGIGGGIVLERNLLRGQYGFAGTIGHMVLHAGGRSCNCGRHGCLETSVSTAALIREYKNLGGEEMEEEAAFALTINQLAQRGDHKAQQAYSIMAEHLAEGIANLINILDPESIFLSGGLIEGYSAFAPEVERRVAKLLHFGAKRKPQVLTAAARRFAGVQGAAVLAFEVVNAFR